MKLRGHHLTSSGIDSIRSKIFNNFVSNSKTSRNLYQIDELPGRDLPERQMPVFDRTKTPEPQKKFEFGLSIDKPDKELLRPSVRENRELDVWKIEDYPFRDRAGLPVADKFEEFSIADASNATRTIKQDLCIFSDLSPVPRKISNLTFDEEKDFLVESKKYLANNHGSIHLLKVKATLQMIEKISWNEARNLCMGFLLKLDCFHSINGTEVEDLDEIQDKVGKEEVVKMKTVESGNLNDELSELEKEMIQMLESLNQKAPGNNSDEKIAALLEIVEAKMRMSREAASNMQLRVLYQFLLEYKKAKDSKSTSVNQSAAKSSKKYSPEKPNRRVDQKTRGKKPQYK